MTRKMRTKKTSHGKLIGGLLACIIIITCCTWFFLFRGLAAKGEKVFFITSNDNITNIYNKIEPSCRPIQFAVFKWLVGLSGYENHIRPGRYAINTQGALLTLRNLRNGHQAAVHLTIPSVRKLEDMADIICKKMQFSIKEFLSAANDNDFCKSLGYNPQTIIAIFIPNTYDVYWNLSAKEFLGKMKQESDKFWNDSRKDKAKEDKLTPIQISTLASLVQEETNNIKEKPIIAGIYINRLHINMPLQSCPTIRYSLNDFTIKRLYENMLLTDSPYNTYKNRGLPPGPIRNPNPEDIDAVLNYEHHDYLYMCASSNFDGTHHFSKTYEEHKAYSVEYDKELNRRSIR